MLFALIVLTSSALSAASATRAATPPPVSLGSVSMGSVSTAKKSAKPTRMVSLGAAATYGQQVSILHLHIFSTPILHLHTFFHLFPNVYKFPVQFGLVRGDIHHKFYCNLQKYWLALLICFLCLLSHHF